MAQIQDYQVNYDISVKADGIDKITDFANAISKLKMSKESHKCPNNDGQIECYV